MSNPLAPLLQVLQNPDNPNFMQAVARLDAIRPQDIPPGEMTALIALLETTITTLTQHKAATGDELAKLRRQAGAMQSYANRK